jgi:DNA repair exonuclease SbcCD ATPase subunit
MTKLVWCVVLPLLLIMAACVERNQPIDIGENLGHKEKVIVPAPLKRSNITEAHVLQTEPNDNESGNFPVSGNQEAKHGKVKETNPIKNANHSEAELKKVEEEVDKLEKTFEGVDNSEEDLADLEEFEENVNETVEEIDQIEQSLQELNSLIEELNELTKLEKQLQQLENLLNQ